MAAALYSYFYHHCHLRSIRGFFLSFLSGQKWTILKDSCCIACKFFMRRECSWYVNSMQSLLELQKNSIEGNKFKAKVRGIAWESLSILGRQEPEKVVMLHGDINESWRHWKLESFRLKFHWLFSCTVPLSAGKRLLISNISGSHKFPASFQAPRQL